MSNIYRLSYIAFLVLITGISTAQILPNRYVEDIFTSVNETTGILISMDVPQPIDPFLLFSCSWFSGFPINVREYDLSYEDLFMNVFEPEGDTMALRPLIIICFGGGFVGGSKDYWSMRLLAQDLAKRGFVTALIDYRLGMEFSDTELSKRAVYRGVQDGRSAVRYFRATAAGANPYRIDPNLIFMGGHSAGALIALHNAYMDKDEERPLSTRVTSQSNNTVPDQGMLDEVGLNQGYNGKANAIFSMAGGLGDTTWMESITDLPLILFHSTMDPTVNFVYGKPFDDPLYNFCGNNLPNLHGSFNIWKRASTLGIPVEHHWYTNRDHGVHENGDSELHTDIVPKISNFFYREMLKPPVHPIFGDEVLCTSDNIRDYHTSANKAKYYDWMITGGTIITGSPSDTMISIDWDEMAAEHKLELVPYSIHGARGDTTILEIDIITSGSNNWIADNGVWQHPGNWSTNHIPLVCEHVLVPDQIENITIEIPTGDLVKIRSLDLGDKVELLLKFNAQLRITDGM